jgi:hypothetical protein
VSIPATSDACRAAGIRATTKKEVEAASDEAAIYADVSV